MMYWNKTKVSLIPVFANHSDDQINGGLVGQMSNHPEKINFVTQ